MNEQPDGSDPGRETAQLLAGRVVVVTGASRGIGYAIARRSAAAGARVLAVSRSGGAPEHPSIEPLVADVRDDEAPVRIVDAAVSTFGRLDGLVNNAGTIHHADCWEHSDEAWDELFETNLTAPFRLSQQAVVHWLERGQAGVIVNLASIESEVVCPRQAGYAATKGGIVGLTRSMAVDLTARDIRVVAIAPGYIDTEQEAIHPDDLKASIPAGRLGLPDEVAGAAIFLLSDLASYAAGTTVAVDGGYLAR
jgi:2-deoxy-D-gluconate 3-dehydrogenase